MRDQDIIDRVYPHSVEPQPDEPDPMAEILAWCVATGIVIAVVAGVLWTVPG